MLLTRKDIVAIAVLTFAVLATIIAVRYLPYPTLHHPISLAVITMAILVVQFELFRTLVRNIRYQHRRTFRQIESFVQLVQCLDLDKPLPSMRNWAISPDFANMLIELIDEIRPATIVEIGGGASTLICAHRLKSLSLESRIISFDHDQRYAVSTGRNVERHGLSEYVNIIHAPLTTISVGDDSWQWYDISSSALPSDIDLLIVDGPPGTTQRLARYPALPILYDRLSPKSALIMDDCNRQDEKEIVDRWRREYPDFVVEHINVEKGAVVFRRSAIT